jgi:serine/threonine kinase 32
MYQDIMSKSDLEFPRHLSRESIDLMRKMLDKNPLTRLSHPEDIRKHPFCAGIDWLSILRRECEAPIKVDFNRSNFDSEYTEQPIELRAEEEDYD